MYGHYHYGAAYGEAGIHPALHTSMLFRVVKGKGGWTYQQWANGDIQIVGAPKPYSISTLPGGGFYSAAGRSKQWTAITKEIGATGQKAAAAAAAMAAQLLTRDGSVARVPGTSVMTMPGAAESEGGGGSGVAGLQKFAPIFVGLSIAGMLVIAALVLFSMDSKKQRAAVAGAE